MKILPLALAALLCAAPASAGAPGTAAAAARALAPLVAEDPAGLEDLFDRKFFRGV